MQMIYAEVEKLMSDKLHQQFILLGKPKSTIRRLAYEIQEKLHQVKRMEESLLETFSEWLDVFLLF